MDIKKYREQITKVIEGESPVGDRLLDDTLLDFVENQMMKIGSLSHADVQWEEAEKGALTLLENKTKDVKILTYLLQCLQHQTTPERFTLSVYVLADFMDAYWDTCHPAPGPRGALPRRKFYGQIIQRTVKAAESLDGNSFDFDQKEELEKAIVVLTQAVKKYELPEDGVEGVGAAVRRKLSSVSRQDSKANATKGQSTAIVEPVFGGHSKVEIDRSSDKAVRQTFFKVADLLADLDGGQALSLRLRRFAIWFSISAAPDADSNGETQLMPVSVDRVTEYEDQLQRGADLALWRNVEKSLTVAPFWLDGHYLSFRVASKLGKEDWAEAIRSEARAFVSRLPSLLHLSFKGGSPFAGVDTAHWLTATSEKSSGGESSGGWEAMRNNALELAKEGGVSVALAQLNEGLATAREPRDKFYWRMLSADVMHSHQLSAIARQEYETLLDQVSKVSVSDWEPSLIQRLKTGAEAV
jgi:type VI secretion system protein VasJ